MAPKNESIFGNNAFNPKTGGVYNPLANRRKIPIAMETDLRFLGEVRGRQFYAAKLNDGREAELTISGELLPHPELASPEVGVAIQSAPYIAHGAERVTWAGGHLFPVGAFEEQCAVFEKETGRRPPQFERGYMSVGHGSDVRYDKSRG